MREIEGDILGEGKMGAEIRLRGRLMTEFKKPIPAGREKERGKLRHGGTQWV